MGSWLTGKLGCAWVVVISWCVGGVFKLYVLCHCVEAARQREAVKPVLPTPRPIRPVHNLTLKKIDTAAYFTLVKLSFKTSQL